MSSSPSKPESSASQALESVINTHPFLAGLKAEHLRVLRDNAMMVHYQPGEVIFREGDPANRFYLIERGKVALESSLQTKNTKPFQKNTKRTKKNFLLPHNPQRHK
jgi:CRP-like cAMP-binding protein